ncbi:protein IQ-DOMAIN 31-like isoform X1 [Gossypium australe]|uniref:Protein IQ-DOMAIN 31-like isoform X1 n=1 Tax=Gossypium australe TaxID=47621 RepID=A0A5B6UJJ2_9ROSI|nr:protein IQ-DOMAIN 31-like isoform X1 [Gossypium australe]
MLYVSSSDCCLQKVANDSQVLVAARASESDLAVAPPFSSQLNPHTTERDERRLELGNKETANISHDDETSLPMSQDRDSQKFALQDSPSNPERIKQEQSATLVQAAFRGYLGRRAFWALKGIIRLQALIRGHLVKRQAISTLCCMMGIVKLQARVRGQMFNLFVVLWQESKLVVSLGFNMPSHIGKLSAHAFVRKLIASSPTVMPLRLRYDVGEPNSVWIWLERWSASCFWKPVPQPKKTSNTKFQKKQVNGQTVEMDTGRAKRSVRRIPPANMDGTSVRATSEFDKPKCNPRNISCHPAEPVQENPQNELEKVKRNLRKVHNPVVEHSLQSEFEFEKLKSLEKVSSTPDLDIVEESLNRSAEKTSKEAAMTANNSADKMKKERALTVNSSVEKRKKEMAMAVNSSTEKMSREMTTVNISAEGLNKEMAVTVNGSSKVIKKQVTTAASESPEIETMPWPLGMNETADSLHADCAAVDSKPSIDITIKDENSPITNVELKRKDGSMNESQLQKSSKKASNPAKQVGTENGLQNSPVLPSYMAATESAKAKLRLQGSPRSGQDGDDKSNLTRRQSLPSPANSKLSSHSPRTQRLVHSGKVENKRDRSALSSQDGNAKATQVEWRR